MANETPPPPPAVPQTVPRTPTVAIWSLVLAILSFFCGWLLTAIPAVICGHVARSKIRKSGGALRGEGIATAGLILGYIALVLGVMGIPLLVSMPGFPPQETTAIIFNPERRNTQIPLARTESLRCLPRAFEAY